MLKLNTIIDNKKYNQSNPKENLSQRAYLNTVTAGIDFGAKQIVGFILNPIMVTFLGPVFYGVWKIIGQLGNYMVIADINVSQPLKLLIARERSVKNGNELRNYVTQALFANIFFLPLYIIAGSILVWFSPYVAGVEENYFLVVRSASGLLVLAFIVKQLFAIAESVLRGMNLAYKRMGLRAAITVLGGALTAGTLYLGYGLTGIAAVNFLTAVFSGIAILGVARENVNWFGFAKVKLLEVKSFIKLSGWFMVENIVRLIDRSSDMILLGFFAGPTYVGVYAISKFLMNSATGAINQILPALTPGLAKLIGEGDHEKVLKVRSQMTSLIWMFGSAFGSVICLWNESFISVWTTQEYFVGQLETLLIVIVAIQMALQQIDGSLINVYLDLRNKIIVTAISLLSTIVLAIVLIPLYQTAGLLFALLVGKIWIGFGYSQIISMKMNSGHLIREIFFSRTAVICTLILLGSGYTGSPVYVTGWIHLIIAMVISFTIVSSLIWMLALSSVDRKWIKELFSKVKFFNKND